MENLKPVLFSVSLLVGISSAAPRNNKYEIKIPDGCEKTGFCSIRPEGYDAIEDKINSLLTPHMIANVAYRVGEPYKPETDPDNCPTIIRSTPAYTFIKFENKTDVDIIVQTKLFPQRIDYVICANNLMDAESSKSDNKQCFNRLGMSDFLHFSCQPSNAIRKVYVYDPQLHVIKPKNYSLPVCCSCQVRNNFK